MIEKVNQQILFLQESNNPNNVYILKVKITFECHNLKFITTNENLSMKI